MEGMDMRNLVFMVEQGNQEAFTKLYEETSKTVYFICLSFLNNEEDAKDVMQDVYITAYNYLPQLNEKEKFQAWINQIAVNKCKRFLMKDTAIPMADEDLSNIKLEDNENFLPEEYITKKEKRKIVMNIMRERLSDIQYETVILYYFNGLTIDEIADIMECPPGTVKYRLSVARGKIKEGVLAYEKGTDDKLYSFAAVPFLASLLAAEASGLEVPHLAGQIINTLIYNATNAATTAVGDMINASEVSAISQTSTVGVVAKTGLAALKVKIAVGVAAVALVGGGIAAVVIHNNNKDEEIDNKDTVESQIDESEEGHDNVAHGTPTEQVDESQSHDNTENEESQNNSEEIMDYPTASELRDLLVSEMGYTYCPDEDIVDVSENGQNHYVLRWETEGVEVKVDILYAPLSERPLLLTVSTGSAVSGDNEKMLETLAFVCTTEEAKATVRQYSAGTPIDDNGFRSLIQVGYESIRINAEEKWEEDIIFPYKQHGEVNLDWPWPNV